MQSEFQLGTEHPFLMGNAKWKFGCDQDFHLRGAERYLPCNYHAVLSQLVRMSHGCHLWLQVCDNSNLAKGFAVVGATNGIGRMIVGFVIPLCVSCDDGWFDCRDLPWADSWPNRRASMPCLNIRSFAVSHTFSLVFLLQTWLCFLS